MNKAATFLLLLCGLMLSGCAGGNAASREYKIYCGMSSKQGEVSETSWRNFCDRHVSAAFPDGYTVLDATGYWRTGSNATATERAKVILIVAPADAREKVRAVAHRYREEFDQEAVLISASDAETEVVQATTQTAK